MVVVRPGAPNAALTGAWSTVVREPLAGALSLSGTSVAITSSSHPVSPCSASSLRARLRNQYPLGCANADRELSGCGAGLSSSMSARVLTGQDHAARPFPLARIPQHLACRGRAYSRVCSCTLRLLSGSANHFDCPMPPELLACWPRHVLLVASCNFPELSTFY